VQCSPFVKNLRVAQGTNTYNNNNNIIITVIIIRFINARNVDGPVPVKRRPVNEGKNYGPIFDFNYRQYEYQNIII